MGVLRVSSREETRGARRADTGLDCASAAPQVCARSSGPAVSAARLPPRALPALDPGTLVSTCFVVLARPGSRAGKLWGHVSG